MEKESRYLLIYLHIIFLSSCNEEGTNTDMGL